LKIVNRKVAFRASGAGRLLGGRRHGRPNHGQERCAKKMFQALEHLSPLRPKIYHESRSAAF
jgi:hypothetical protein